MLNRIFLILALLLFCAVPSVQGQGTVQGQEITISYSGTNAQLVQPGTPLTNLASGTGTNTFILSISNPTVAIRLYITNGTANACSSPVTVQMFSSSDAQVTSFNNSLANWQTVLLQSPLSNSTLVPNVQLTIPASAAIYVSSTAIVSPKVAIQVVSTSGVCATTTVEVVAVVTQVSVSSPLVSTTSSSPNFSANTVQGILANGNAANIINPVLMSGAGPSTNAGFQTTGLDTFNGMAEFPVSTVVPAATFNYGTVPVPAQGVSEIALAIYSGVNGTCGIQSHNSGWVNTAAIPGGGSFGIATLFPSIAGYPFTTSNSNASGCNWTINKTFGALINFRATAVLAEAAIAFPAGPNAGQNPAGSTILVIAVCQTASSCGITSIADTLGLSFARVTRAFDGSIGGSNISGMDVWASTSTNPGGADTMTLTTFGTVAGSQMWATLSGVSQSSLVQPQTSIETDSLGAQVVRQDAIGANQVNCSVTLSTNTTTQLANCVTATSINGVAVRYYITDIQLNTTTAGSATTIQLVTGTGANCASGQTNLTAIAYPNTTTGIQNIIGYRTALLAPLQTAVCATQAGTTAGTTVVEIHGYLAP